MTETGNFILPPQESWAVNGYWLYTAVLKDSAPVSRDMLMEKMLKNGVETRPAFYPLHQMPPYKNYPSKSNFENADHISAQGISFPSSVNITQQELDNIEHALHSIFQTKHISA